MRQACLQAPHLGSLIQAVAVLSQCGEQHDKVDTPAAEHPSAGNVQSVLCAVQGPELETFKRRLVGLQTSDSSHVSASQIEGLVRETAPSLSRHQAIAILRQLQMSGAQQAPVEALSIR